MLEINGISMTFGGLAALQDVSMDVEAGSVSSIIGPNGAGKTTLFNIITGFLRPTKGSLVYEGREITGLRASKVARSGIVRTFQKTEVFPDLTVRDCVRTGFLCHRYFSVPAVLLGGRRIRAFEEEATTGTEAILDFVGLTQRGEILASQLSYGEQRLLEIAVGLAASPRLMLLDEPASGMNVDEAERIKTIIRRLKERGITILLVEHNMRVVMSISDYVVVLNHGEKIAEGPPDEISDNPEVISAYLGEGWKNADA